MIGTIRKHQKWLWSIIIAVTIVTFVGWLSPNSRNRGGYGNSDVDLGSVFGEPVSRDAYWEAKTEERLEFYLRFGQWPAQEDQLRQMGYDLEQKTYQRLFMNAKAKQLNIVVSDEAVARRIRSLFGIQGDQPIPQQVYAEFVVRQLQPNNCTQYDFERFVRNSVAQEQLIGMFGLSGDLITPKEGESLYKRQNEPIATSVAFFNSTNFASQVSVTPRALQEYYTNNQAAYRIPEKVQVAYVKFDKTNFTSEVSSTVTNLDQIVNATYAEKGAAFFKDKDGKQMSEAEAKNVIKGQIFETGTLTLARKKAQGFINEAYEKFSNDTLTYDKLAAFAKEKGASVFTTEPFDNSGPKNLKVTGEFAQAAFSLSPINRNDPDDKTQRSLMYRKALSGEDGAYVVMLKQRVPSRLQSFEEVKAEVTKDYVRSKGTELAIAAGEKFETALTNGLASGKSFADMCKAFNVKPVELPPFSLATRVYPELDKDQFQELQHAVSGLPVGKASGFLQGFDGGFVAYVKERQQIDPAKAKTEMPAFLEQVRSTHQMAAFNEWFQKNYPVAVRRPVTSTKSEG